MFNFVGGLIVYGIGMWLVGVLYGRPYHERNPWREAWLYTGAISLAAFGLAAILI